MTGADMSGKQILMDCFPSHQLAQKHNSVKLAGDDNIDDQGSY